MSVQAARLRALFERPGLIRLAGAHNALGAKLVERAGFEGVWSSSLEISTSYAVPDANILTMSEYLAAAQGMVDAVGIPVVADCDTGYGNSSNAIHMVRKFEAAGVAAVCIEDKLFPKVNSLAAHRQELAPIAAFVGKIMAAKSAQRSREFMVIARVEALIAGLGQAEALRRAHAYVEAGADAILIHSAARTPEEIRQFVRAWDGAAPLVVVPTTYYTMTAKELEAFGVKMVIYANHGLRASIQAVSRALEEILRTGSSTAIEETIAPIDEVLKLQGMPRLAREEAVYECAGQGRTRAVILAAGDHLEEYSMKDIAADIPMAMLDVNGKPLLQRQREVLRSAGIRDIVVVGGYKCERIEVDGIRLVANPDYKTRGIAYSLLCVEGDYDERTLIAYSDIIFEREALEKLLQSEADLTLLVDPTHAARGDAGAKRLDLVALAEPLPRPRRMLGATNGAVRKIGKRIEPNEASGEFVGLALFTKAGLGFFREIHDAVRAGDARQPFHEAPSVDQASFTDVIQEMIDRGHTVSCVQISSGWMEIHSFENYKQACTLLGRA